MLTYMRKNAGSWIVKVIFAVIIIVFVFFYGYGEQGPEERVLVTVGDAKITTAQYRKAYSNMIQMYQQMYQNQITDELARSLGLQQNLLDEMIERELLLQEAENLNVLVSKEEIKSAVMQQPYMQENGAFSERRYAAVLSRMKMTAAEYEQQAAQEIMQNALRSMITQAVTVSDQELVDVFQLRGEKLSIDYLEFSQSDVVEEITVSEEELQAYYDKNQEKYRINEMAQAHYIVFDPKDFVGRMNVDEEEVRDLYNADQARFVEPEQIRARHILLKVDSAAEPKEVTAAQEQAQGLLVKIKNGADFGALAKKYSQDEATASVGGDLGFFNRGAMVGPFETAALDLKPGEVSEIVQTQFGYHIIKLEERKPKRVRPLEEVRAEIIRDVQQDAAEREVRTASRRAFNRLFSSRDLEGYAQDNGLTVQKTGLFVFGEGPEDAQSENSFSRQVFALQPDELTPVFSINKKYYLVKLTDKKQAHIAPLETVREAVLSEVQRNKRFEYARKQAKNALTVLTENEFDWEAVAKKFGLEIKQVEITRSGDFVAGLGRNPELKQAAFKLDAGQTADLAFATDSSFVLVRVRVKTFPSEEEFEAEKEQLRQQLLQAKQQETLKEYVQKLKEQYSVNLDRELFETL